MLVGSGVAWVVLPQSVLQTSPTTSAPVTVPKLKVASVMLVEAVTPLTAKLKVAD